MSADLPAMLGHAGLAEKKTGMGMGSLISDASPLRHHLKQASLNLSGKLPDVLVRIV